MSKLIVLYFRFKALFSNYSVICLPWRPLWKVQSRAKTNLFIVGWFSTRPSHLCHRPGSNTSENTKTKLLKASYHPLPVFCSVEVEGVAAWSAHVLIVLLSLWFTLLLIAAAHAHCLYLLRVSRAHIAAIPWRHQYFSAFHFLPWYTMSATPGAW